jgi:hypothetical protein
MPPKKGGTQTVAYVAKCNKCSKKHWPPSHEVCMALLTTDPDNQSDVVNPDDWDSDENQSDDHVGTDDMLHVSGGPSGEAGNHAVTQMVTQDTASRQAGSNAVILAAVQTDRPAVM